MGDESFGLNIVCEAPPSAGTTAAGGGGGLLVKKRKKQSKYERRRQKNKKGRHQQQHQQQNQHQQPVAASPAPAAPAATTPLEETAKEQEPEHDVGSTNVEEVTMKQPQQDEAPSAPALVEADQVVEPSVSKDDAVAPEPTTTDTPVETPVVPSEPAPVVIIPSRKKHNAATLDDEEERAKYMAEFHARPLEMDRRSGAKAFCTPSRDSTHLFDQATQDTPTDSSKPQAQSMLQQLNPKLRTYCQQHFDMDQATVIQSNTWSQFYSTKKPLANLFIQSETGSGKTLAYLLPIIQVRSIWLIVSFAHDLHEEENELWLRPE